MVNIHTNDAQVEKYLTRIYDKIIGAGGFIHPNIHFVHSDNGFSIEKHGEIEDRHFIKVPHEMLVPYHDFDVDIEGDDIVLASYPSNIERPQFELFEDVLALYNVSNKMKTHRQECLWLNHEGAWDTIKLLLKDRGGRDLKLIKTMIGNDEFEDELALFSFFKSRMAYCRLGSRTNPFTEVFLPLIEFLNHHPLGAGYDNLYLGKEQRGFMGVEPRTPVENNKECYASYGTFDALECYIHYGFTDTHTQFLRSIPIRLNMKDMGTIVFKAQNVFVPIDQRPEHLKNLKAYLPNISPSNNNNATTVSHIIVPGRNAPFSMRRVLHEVLLNVQSDIEDDKALSLIETMEEQILKTNEEFYDKVELTLASLNDASPVKKTIKSLVKQQKDILSTYRVLHGL